MFYDVYDYCPRAVPNSAIIFTASRFTVFGKYSIALQERGDAEISEWTDASSKIDEIMFQNLFDRTYRRVRLRLLTLIKKMFQRNPNSMMR